MILILFIIAFLTALTVTNAECANGCNGHGKCTSYDMCICCRNWQGSDCSERVCSFGLAHVDTPKGDLDMDGVVSPPIHQVAENSFAYPYGTTEQFPLMQDSDLQDLTDSAHYYMECSNKGSCNRATGECQCFDGYDGVSCQRASCPGYPLSCSGHGTCQTIKQLAAADNGNVYRLWDKDATMGCSCDAGYSGPDCSLRQCKTGVDPLYLDDVSTVKYSTFEFATLTTAPTISFTDGQSASEMGYWAIRYFDSFDEDWVTRPIPAGASCAEVVDALESLPNNVIPSGQTYCSFVSVVNGIQNEFSGLNAFYDVQHPAGSRHPYRLAFKLDLWEAFTPVNEGELSSYTPKTLYTSSNDTQTHAISGYIYQIKFMGNPGALKQPEIELYLDGARPKLVSPGYKVITKVWTDGQQGEDKDYFADHCDGVTVTIGKAYAKTGTYAATGIKTKTSILTSFTQAEKNLLKTCLGNSDFDNSNNQDVYNWDKGSRLYPHIIKLVRTVSTYQDGGFYAVIWYDTSVQLDNLHSETDGTFKLLNQFSPPDNFETDNYDIYTTQGTLALTTNRSEATFGFASKYIYTTNVTYDVMRINDTAAHYYDGDISCDVGNTNAGKLKYLFHCLNKTDLFTVFNWDFPEYNPSYINLYTAKRLHTTPVEYDVITRFPHILKQHKRGNNITENEMHYMTHVITTDLSTNWGVSVGGSKTDVGAPQFQVYKFFPAPASTYTYVAPCSNRGICEEDTGVCKCFSGYSSDSCHEQASVSC